jgi:hypothetical protein
MAGFLFGRIRDILASMQTRRTLMILALAALAAVVFVLNYVAGLYYFYWLYWWYDIMMHFLGGALIGGLAVWGAVYHSPSLTWRQLLGIALCTIALIGGGWEFFEYLTGQYVGQVGVAFDTTIDLIMDLIGTLIAAAVVCRLSRSRPSLSS